MEDPAALQCNLVGNPLHEEQSMRAARVQLYTTGLNAADRTATGIKMNDSIEERWRWPALTTTTLPSFRKELMLFRSCSARPSFDTLGLAWTTLRTR